MPEEITASTIRTLWENNTDTPITSSSLSKDFDFLATYQDFELTEPVLHREGTLLTIDRDNDFQLILKKGTMFQIINEAENEFGTPIIPINSQYRIFDIGLDDLYLTVNNIDEFQGLNWENSIEWFIYICDKDDSTIYQEETPEQYGGGGEILISRNKDYPRRQVPGRLESNYSEKDTRVIGGFKSNSLGEIIQESIWDISGKTHTVKAKHYWVLDEYGIGLDGKYIYRQINLSDLDTSSDILINTFNNDVTIHGVLTQDSGNISLVGDMSLTGAITQTSGNISLVGDMILTGAITQTSGDVNLQGSSISIDGALSQENGIITLGLLEDYSDMSHWGSYYNKGTFYTIDTGDVTIDASAISITATNPVSLTTSGTLTTSSSGWTNTGNLETTGNLEATGDLTVHGSVLQNTGTSIDLSGDVNLNNAALSHIHVSDVQGIHVIQPKGAMLTTDDSLTGYIKITLPVSWTSTLMRMSIDVFVYESEIITGSSFSIDVGGTNNTAGAWGSVFANITAGRTDRLFNVRFGHDGTNCAIYIGESATAWGMTQIQVRNFFGGFANASLANWSDGWDVSVTPTLGTISQVLAAESVSTYSLNSDKLDDLNSTEFVQKTEIAGGEAVFNNTPLSATTVTHNMGTTNYYVSITPSSPTGGYLGEWYVSNIGINTFDVIKTGSATNINFHWLLQTFN